MTSIKCEYCDAELKNKKCYNQHLKGNKKCLAIRGIKSEESYSCDKCGKSFVSKLGHKNHTSKCTNDTFESKMELAQKENFKLKQELDKLKNQLARSQIKEKKVENRTNFIINNGNMNLYSLTINVHAVDIHLLNSKKHLFTVDQFQYPVKGIAQFLSETVLNRDPFPNYVCVDEKEQEYMFLNDKGLYEMDKNGQKLLTLFCVSIRSDVYTLEDKLEGKVGKYNFDGMKHAKEMLSYIIYDYYEDNEETDDFEYQCEEFKRNSYIEMRGKVIGNLIVPKCSRSMLPARLVGTKKIEDLSSLML